MDLQQFLREKECFKFLKWVEIIQQENLAVKLDSMYILEKDKQWCDVIFIDGNGFKRKVGGASYEQIREKFALLDLSNLSPETKEFWKSEIGGESSTIQIGETTTLNPGEEASVTNSGTEKDAVLNFSIPRGGKGDKGDPGNISIVNFNINDDMHLIMNLETNTNLNFTLDDNGHLILTN